MSWYEARDACASMNAQLVVIGDMDENMYVAGVAINGKHWIGLSDQDRDGPWQWGAGLWNIVRCFIQRLFVCKR